MVRTSLMVLMLLGGAAAQASPVTLTANLAGGAEVQGGDPDGSGQFRVELDPDTNDFCYSLWTERTGRPTMAHIHTGAAGAEGPVLFPIEVTGRNNDMCIAVDKDKLDPIVDNPAGFYVNVHTADFANGAVRGQLVKP